MTPDEWSKEMQAEVSSLVAKVDRLRAENAQLRSEYDSLCLSFERFERLDEAVEAVRGHVGQMVAKGCCGWHRERLEAILAALAEPTP